MTQHHTKTPDTEASVVGSGSTKSLPPQAFSTTHRLITRRELRTIIPYTPQHIMRLEKKGLFPRRIQVGANRVAWLQSEVEQWIAKRVRERDCD
jgi:prophage regulatory protein